VKAAVKTLGAAALAAALLLPGVARAQMPTVGDGSPPHGRYHSSQNFAFQLSFGPYKPDVDSEFDSGRTPYRDFFGNGRHLMTQAELDYQIVRKLMGTFGIGVGVGYFQVTGTAPVANSTATPSGDHSTLRVVPISLSAVYRFDNFLVTKDFPLVPYARLGLDWAYWQITDGNGEIATDGRGGRGQGGTFGWHGAIGIAFVIDMLDPDAARSFDSDLGVNHTAVTFEFQHSDISGLGQPDRLHVGDDTWSAGILIEF
jgi:hypothetical protein